MLRADEPVIDRARMLSATRRSSRASRAGVVFVQGGHHL
jgi:hypothetical protein